MPPPTQPTVVQQGAPVGQAASGTTVVQGLSGVTAGNMLWLAVSCTGNDGVTMSVADSSGNTWVQAARGDANGRASELWYALAVAAGSPTVTVTFSEAVPNRLLFLREVSGLAAFVDATLQTTGTGTAPVSDPLTMAATYTYVVGFTRTATGITAFSSAGGYGNLQEVSSAGPSNPMDAAVEDRVWPTAGTRTASFSLSDSASWLALAMAFRPPTPTNNDPTQTTASVPATGVVGSVRTVTVQARKSDGSDMTVGGATVVVTVTGANPATPTVTDHGDGTYTCTQTPASAGSDSVAITLGGVAISGSPYTSTVTASGATITSAAAGNWSVGANWVGGVAPGNGDTAILAHNMAVDVTSITVGTSGAAGTVAITINAGKTLTINAGKTLYCRGDIVPAGNYSGTDVGCVVNNGVLEFDSSGSASPSTTAYKMSFSGSTSECRLLLTVQGTAGAYAEVRSNAGGAYGYLTRGTATRSFSLTAQYAIFRRLGSASQDALFFSYGSNVDVRDTLVDTCGRIGWVGAPDAAANVRWQRVTHVNSQGATSIEFESYTGATGTRLIDDCVFDKAPSIQMPGFTVQDSLFYVAPVITGASGGVTATGNLIRSDVASPHTVFVPAEYDSIYLKDGAIVNPDWVQPHESLTAVTLDGAILLSEGNTDRTGDGFNAALPAAPTLYTIIRSLKLPMADGTGFGTLAALGGNANVKIRVLHSTWHLGSESDTEAGTVRVGETYAGYAGMIDQLKDNICWDTVARAGNYKITNIAGSPVTDIVAAANADYNCGWNIQAGSEGKGYDTPMTGTPGAHDVDVDPQFVDPTRRLSTFDLLQGGPGTTANCLAELMKRHNPEAGYNPAYTIAAIRDYIRAGYAPTNAAIATAASDGTTMGAVAYVATGITDNDPTQTTASVPATKVVGTLRTITVQARKSDGSAMTVGGATVVVTITGANASTPTVTDNGDGTYGCSDTPATLGADSVAITLGGVAISGSPYASTVVAGGGGGGFTELINGGLIRS